MFLNSLTCLNVGTSCCYFGEISFYGTQYIERVRSSPPNVNKTGDRVSYRLILVINGRFLVACNKVINSRKIRSGYRNGFGSPVIYATLLISGQSTGEVQEVLFSSIIPVAIIFNFSIRNSQLRSTFTAQRAQNIP